MIRNSGFWKNSFSFQYISAFRLINRYVGTIMFPNYTRNIFDNFKSLLYLKKGIVRRNWIIQLYLWQVCTFLFAKYPIFELKCSNVSMLQIVETLVMVTVFFFKNWDQYNFQAFTLYYKPIFITLTLCYKNNWI